jgi:5-methyltetrahydropteroyltriglutamate--homocysteine methyltransferase
MTEILLTTTVGSFGKPEYLQKARNQFARGKLSRAELTELERQATREWIRRQEEVGLDILVDGEMYRGDMVAYFADLLEGYREGGLVRSYGNRYYHKPIIAGNVRRPKPMTVEWFRYAQSLTDKPVKGMLTGPYTMLDWSFNEAYKTRRSRSPRSSGRRPRTSSAQARSTSRSTSRPSTPARRRSASRSRRWASSRST